MNKMHFGGKWIKWMEACIFNSSILVLLNGNVTKDFMVKRGFRQGYPLSLFLLVLTKEGLTCLMNRVVEIREYQGFSVNQEIIVDILQFVGNTIILGDRDNNYLWILKEIFRGSLGWGLTFTKVTFSGSIWVLSSSINYFPCKFLRVMIGIFIYGKISWEILGTDCRSGNLGTSLWEEELYW